MPATNTPIFSVPTAQPSATQVHSQQEIAHMFQGLYEAVLHCCPAGMVREQAVAWLQYSFILVAWSVTGAGQSQGART